VTTERQPPVHRKDVTDHQEARRKVAEKDKTFLTLGGGSPVIAVYLLIRDFGGGEGTEKEGRTVARATKEEAPLMPGRNRSFAICCAGGER